MSDMTEKQAERARVVFSHLIDKLGVTPDLFAEGVAIDPARFKAFLSGVLPTLNDAERFHLQDEVLSLIEAEDFEVREAKRRMLTPPRTAQDAIKDAMAAK